MILPKEMIAGFILGSTFINPDFIREAQDDIFTHNQAITNSATRNGSIASTNSAK